ncbi:MAG TPA: 50S ribosomal protein L32 [Candidatus Paceibacterota bacterium]|nr:50S ribosomal protein L32 [Candidatus Paceibacterota bacterium]
MTNMFETFAHQATIPLNAFYLKPHSPFFFAFLYCFCYNGPIMVVRMRHTRAHSANRRSHHRLQSPALSKDSSGALHLRHRATKDGLYKGRAVMSDPVKKVLKKQNKAKKSKK